MAGDHLEWRQHDDGLLHHGQAAAGDSQHLAQAHHFNWKQGASWRLTCSGSVRPPRSGRETWNAKKNTQWILRLLSRHRQYLVLGIGYWGFDWYWYWVLVLRFPFLQVLVLVLVLRFDMPKVLKYWGFYLNTSIPIQKSVCWLCSAYSNCTTNHAVETPFCYYKCGNSFSNTYKRIDERR